MRPISDVLALALEEYQEAAARAPGMTERNGYPYMCNIVLELCEVGDISRYECGRMLDLIGEWINHHFSLRLYLKRSGYPFDYAARLQFYKDKLAELKTLEENHEQFR